MEIEENSQVEQEQKGVEEEIFLASAKKDRLKMEEAATTLENRVMYLEKLNAKMHRKIDGAKKKASEIMQLKKRNMEHEELKRSHAEQEEANLRDRQQMIQTMRTEHEERLTSSKMNSQTQSALIAKDTKESLANLRERYRQQKEDMKLSNSANVQVIQEIHKNARNRKREKLVC